MRYVEPVFADLFPLFAPSLVRPHSPHLPPWLAMAVLGHYQRHRTDLDEDVLLFQVAIFQLVGFVRTIHSLHQFRDLHQVVLILKESKIKIDNERKRPKWLENKGEWYSTGTSPVSP